jgi:hypothetical protein
MWQALLFLLDVRRPNYLLLGAGNLALSSFCSGRRVNDAAAKPSQTKRSQAKVLSEGGDLREAQVDVFLSVSHSCACPHRWAL